MGGWGGGGGRRGSRGTAGACTQGQGEGRSHRFIAHATDGTGYIDLVWFQGIKYAQKKYDTGKPYIIFGKPTVFNGRIQVAHPEMEAAAADTQPIATPDYHGNLFGGSAKTPSHSSQAESRAESG